MRLPPPFLLLVVVALAGGCQPAAPPASTTPAESSTSSSPAVGTPAREDGVAAPAGDGSAKPAAPSWATDSEQPYERWEVCRIRGEKVGYVHTRVEPQQDPAGTRLDKVTIEQQLILGRSGQQVRQDMRLISWERPTGELVRFTSELTSSQAPTRARGEVVGNKLTIEMETAGTTERLVLDWDPSWGGFLAAERLVRSGLKPRERRTVRALVPLLHQVGHCELTGLAYEAERVQGESLTLLKVQRVDTLGTTRIESVVWIDQHGEIRKTFQPIPAPGLEVETTTREVALADAPPASFDLNAATVVPVAGLQTNPHTAVRATYRARLADRDPAEVFSRGASQRVQRLDAQRAELQVVALRPDSALTPPAEVPPTDDDRRPNSLVQSNDPAVVALARAAAPGETDEWRLAVALEALVRERVRNRNFTQALASAADVVRSGEGDCTEHAVLLAAVCRARGLAARVAIGLVYVPTSNGFAYHMWNEVWIHDRWIPLDATLARQGIGCGHLKLVTSSLQGVDAYAAFLPVFQVLGKLELEVVAVE